MKQKILSVLVFVTLVVMAFAGIPLNVGANGGPVENIDTGETFATIQAAINDADTLDGHTIEVEDGTYDEVVVIDKELTVQAASTPLIQPTTLGGWPNVGAVNIRADGVTFNGFEVDASLAPKIGINAYGASDVTISNNIVHGADHTWDAIGIIVWDWESDSSVTVDRALIENNEVYDTGRMGIFCMDLNDPDYYDDSTWVAEYGLTTGHIIRGNTVYNTWTNPFGDAGGGIQINVGKDCTISDNLVYDTQNGNMGIYMFGSGTGNMITSNTIRNNPIGIQLWISGEGGNPIDWEGDTATSPGVHCNDIYDNTNYGAYSTNIGGTSMVIDATNNWWGDADGPNHPSNSNYPTIGDEVSDNVDFDPWNDHPASDGCNQPWWITSDSYQVNTHATVSGGGSGSPPFVKCKWETTSSSLLTQTDDYTELSGIQVDPNLGSTKTVYYWAVVTDPQGVDTVTDVYVDVWHPDGSFKYQQPLGDVYGDTLSERSNAVSAFETAYANDLVTLHDATGEFSGMSETEIYNDIVDELSEGLAYLFRGQAVLDYCQPGGWYTVGVRAVDNYAEWSPWLLNQFWYVPTAGIDIDFSDIEYGSAELCTNKWVGGDIYMVNDDGKPTVKNIGNVPVNINILQDDMQFGMTGDEWNVHFDARLGADGTIVDYNPCCLHDASVTDLTGTPAVLPETLELCTQQKLDFSIHIEKGDSTWDYNGLMDLWGTLDESASRPFNTPSQWIGTPPGGVPTTAPSMP